MKYDQKKFTHSLEMVDQGFLDKTKNKFIIFLEESSKAYDDEMNQTLETKSGKSRELNFDG